MITFNKEVWSVHDPDKVIETSSGETHLSSGIYPREDLMYFQHNETNINIDFGFYGDETTMKGLWVVYVIDRSLEHPWEAPIERVESNTFQQGINNVQSAVIKYT